MRNPVFLSVLFTAVTLGALSCHAEPLEITPFYTFNQSPLIQIFGLPEIDSARVRPKGRLWTLLSVDAANDFAWDDNGREQIMLDGESYRLNLALRYGIGDRMEVGMDLPMVGYTGGVFDGFIEGWHRFFDLPQGGRTQVPNDRLLFTYYNRDGQERLHLDRGNFGVGDLRFTGGWQLYDDGSSNPTSLALRSSLKLPTGDSARLQGSGSTDLALWLVGSKDFPLSWGHLAVFGAAGELGMTEGDLLRDQQRHFVTFGSVGLGWSPAEWIAWKAQLYLHGPFYRDSELRELNVTAVQLLVGGTLALGRNTALDIAVSEDANVATSPDVALHVGLSHLF